MNGAAPAFGPRPELSELPVERLFADPAYQRDMRSRGSQKLVEAIAGSFRWAKFGVALVTPWADRGGWAVIDGQHRCEAARRLGIERVPALVYPEMTEAEAAAVFVDVNRNRVAMTPMALHHARLAAGDEHHGMIAEIAARAGVEILRYPVQAAQMKPGQTMAIGAVSAALLTHGPGPTREALSLLAEAFSEEGGRIRARTIRALATVFSEYVGVGDPARARLIAFLRGADEAALQQAITARREGGARTTNEALAGLLAKQMKPARVLSEPLAAAAPVPAPAKGDSGFAAAMRGRRFV